MRQDDRFDELVASLGGFYRTWLVYVGIELGLFAALRDAGDDGLTPDGLAAATDTAREPVEVWAWAADAHELVRFDDGRLTLDADTATVLLDDRAPEFLGGQIVHAVVASLDWDRMLEFFRTGTPVRERPDRYRAAIERLTVQDVAVFFQEALAALPQLVADLGRPGARVVDVHCGGGRWLIAMARRFPELALVGVEFEADSIQRARHNVEVAGLSDRITIEQADVARVRDANIDLAYFQYALHQLPDPAAALRAAAAALRPGGRILVMDWAMPSTVEEFRTRHGELVAGIQLDEVFQGTGLATRETFRQWFRDAELGEPEVIDLPSGASVFLVRRDDAAA